MGAFKGGDGCIAIAIGVDAFIHFAELMADLCEQHESDKSDITIFLGVLLHDAFDDLLGMIDVDFDRDPEGFVSLELFPSEKDSDDSLLVLTALLFLPHLNSSAKFVSAE